MHRRNRQVSLAWLGAIALAAFGLLGAGRTGEASGRLEDADMHAGRSVGVGCTALKELRFEILPANAEPPVPTTRRTPVCLAVYRPQ
ncbi:MAG TPA: hypothetical protein VFL16_17705 [Steroidobacteraceae bacterium]|nr:hypothetical protein [Steroidobacteraceae bacterium]